MIGVRLPIRSGQVADERDHNDGDDVTGVDRDPEIDGFVHADAIGWLHRVGSSEDRGDHRNDVHQRHAHDAQHVGPMVGQRIEDRRPRHIAVPTLFGECGRLIDLAPNDVASDQHQHAE